MDLIEIRKKAKELKGQAGAPGPIEPDVVPGGEPAAPPADAPAAPKAKKPRKAARKKGAPAPEDGTPPEQTELPVPSEPETDTGVPVVDAVSMDAPAPVKPSPQSPAGAGLPGDDDEEGEAEDDTVEYLAFRLATEEYAVKVENVREIIRLQKITTVPRAPDFVRGIISLRGVIIPVFNIKRRLGLAETEKARSTRIIVVADGSGLQGIIVDRVTGVARLKRDTIEPPPAVISGVEAEYIEGVGRIGERLLILFNTGKVLEMEG